MKAELTIGRLADEAGVNVETIRYYQRRGLMAEPQKPASGQRSGSCATKAIKREFMILSCMSAWAEPSAVRELPRVFQLSPTNPSSKLSRPSCRTSRAPTSGRRTISFKTPLSFGACRIFSRPASSSCLVKCLMFGFVPARRPARERSRAFKSRRMPSASESYS